jgi:site-specific DNA-methyltransferase (adenine-specific)
MYDAADNSSKSYDVAISSLRERLEKSRTVVDGCTLYNEDCRFILPTLHNVDSIVTDPPYHLTSIVKRFGKPNSAPAKSNGETGVYGRSARGFMGKTWDGGDIAFDPELWKLCLNALKPGGHLLAFGGTRTYHRMACAIEDAGFEIRDCIAWVYGSGFPKSHNLSDEWAGWGTALKPAFEPIIVARNPISEKSVAANVLEHGTGALNIDGCRVETGDLLGGGAEKRVAIEGKHEGWARPWMHNKEAVDAHADRVRSNVRRAESLGRWPANFIHDGSEEVVRLFPETASGSIALHHQRTSTKTKHSFGERAAPPEETFGDAGSAARFFYCSKADKDDRLKSKHPTVKPIDLMAYLVRLVTQPGGTVLDPFAGSGSTGMACMREGMNCILIEREEEYFADILHRVSHVRGEDTPLFAQVETTAPEKQLDLEESLSNAQ